MPTVLINRSYKTTEEPGCAIVERREIDSCPSTSDRLGAKVRVMAKAVVVEGHDGVLSSLAEVDGQPEDL